MLPAEDLSKDFVDDDLLSCFLWAAGENAVAQPGWESPSVNPLKGIPLPPAMPPLPPPDVGPSATTGGSRAARAAADDEDDGEEEDLRGGNPNLSKEQKLTQRMQRKAESARVARLRKKEYVGELSGQKDSIQSDRELKGKISSLIQELRRHVGQHISSSQSITDGLRRILTPHQAKFLVWVERNQRSMDMLNTMFSEDVE
ncbi:hypothetical protein EMIHUDRAFT_452653 [Emiliania huxleyi CCMP1516]|uniref:BZIP domain-containing protein n=2 Tax=Emiliania huxleyi TaxID=2903 RepID=A0A0D3IHL0_EMIH1|nr:hypothetical protein EMIHUDRAFT_452653 [Emiliania huxleyi CCMP1516]EOD10745.1 hypothetical protein EMIHUDRAFT_452653 [Emiliania huxleyi CCMP1516]|eukprot:XP_005763174.1 hypothetical protein EMIHUDRAFT_452653 [Emiliania huxleyi CCMP1516]